MARTDITLISELTNKVRTVTNAGGSTTTEYDRVLNRWNEYTANEYSAQEQLTAALLGDEPMERIGELRALALAELCTPVDKATVTNEMAGAVFPVLHNEYAKVAAANYETVRQQFNKLAADFTKSASTVHPETDPAKLLSADAKTRSAWADAGITALELTNTIAALSTAAQLAGIPAANNDAHLSLTIDAAGLHRRRVWEAWETKGRTNQWAAILDAGATIHAPALEDHKPYRRPAPIELQTVRSGMGYRQVEVDPEDSNHTQALNTQDVANRLNRALVL